MQDREPIGFEPPFCAQYFTEKTGNPTRIPGLFCIVCTENFRLKTASHLKRRDSRGRQGEKRRNTGHVFRAFSTQYDAGRSLLRLSDPYLARPKGRATWGDDRFCEALFRLYRTENSGNTESIPGAFHIVWTGNTSRKTASHRKKILFATVVALSCTP